MDNGQIAGLIEAILGELLKADPSYFLVDTRIRPTNNIKVFLDGDNGITIEKCVQVNRFLYKKLEESGLFPEGDFSLEVSSPGLDEPLKLIRQYKKNIGRRVEVSLNDGTHKEGKLTEVAEDGIVLEEATATSFAGKQASKKQQLSTHTFLFNNIKTTKIQVIF
jgi:ribosome maturation factor RimP